MVVRQGTTQLQAIHSIPAYGTHPRPIPSSPALTLSDIGWDVREYNPLVYSPTKVIDTSLKF